MGEQWHVCARIVRRRLNSVLSNDLRHIARDVVFLTAFTIFSHRIIVSNAAKSRNQLFSLRTEEYVINARSRASYAQCALNSTQLWTVLCQVFYFIIIITKGSENDDENTNIDCIYGGQCPHWTHVPAYSETATQISVRYIKRKMSVLKLEFILASEFIDANKAASESNIEVILLARGP